MRKLLKLLPEKIRQSIFRSKLNFGTGAPPHIIFKLAETREELEQAFQVLHDAYVEQKYMDPHPSGLRVTKYHALPTTTVLIAKDTIKDKVIATVSIVRCTPLGLPLDAVFPLDELKQKYRHLAEVSSLAVRSEYRRNPSDVLWPLLRYFYKYIREVMRVDAYIIGVNPSWHDLYVGILGFTQLKGLKAEEYSFVNNAPVAAYVVDVVEQEFIFYKYYAHLPTRTNFFKYYRDHKLLKPQYQFPNKRYHSVQTTVMNREFFEYFFTERTDALSKFTDEEKMIVLHYYPEKEYAPLIFGANSRGLREFRGANRFLTRISAQIKLADTFENDAIISVIDFSPNGLRLESSIPLANEIELRVAVGPYDSAYLTAKVRRKFSRSWGLEITACDEAWRNFINEMQSQFFPPNQENRMSNVSILTPASNLKSELNSQKKAG